MPKFFISYAHEDRRFATKLKRTLDGNQSRVWLDTDSLSPHDRVSSQIEKAIKESSVLLLVCSKASRKSEYVQFEWPFALGSGVSVVPLKLDAFRLHPRLQENVWVDVRQTNPKRWKELIKLLAKYDSIVADRSRNLEDANRPELVAKFNLREDGRPILIQGDHYSIAVSVLGAPNDTDRVKYEILYEGFKDNPWSNNEPNKQFSDDMTTYGDVPISVRGFSKAVGRNSIWKIEDMLSTALERGHSGRQNKFVKVAIEDIKKH